MYDDTIEKYFDSLADKWDDFKECDDKTLLELLKRAGVKKGDRVLDVGCGTGVITGLLRDLSNNPVVGVDVSNGMLSVARKKYAGDEKVSFIHSDILALEDDKLYDALVIYNAYPHILDVAALRDKAYSLLRDGGRLIIVHSIGRGELNKHHLKHAATVSRLLSAPTKEAESYAPLFAVTTAEESENDYLLVLTKTGV